MSLQAEWELMKERENEKAQEDDDEPFEENGLGIATSVDEELQSILQLGWDRVR